MLLCPSFHEFPPLPISPVFFPLCTSALCSMSLPRPPPPPPALGLSVLGRAGCRESDVDFGDPTEAGQGSSGVPPWGGPECPGRPAGLGLWHRLTSTIASPRGESSPGTRSTLTLASSCRELPRLCPPEPAHPSLCASEHWPCPSCSRGRLQGIVLLRGSTVTGSQQGVAKEVVFLNGKQDSKTTIAV